jgi:hypothetical protein
MSLINDALKRAKQAHTNPPPTPDLPFRPAEPSPQRTPRLPLLPLAVVLVALLLGGGFILMALLNRDAGPRVVRATPADSQSAPDTTVPPSATPTPPATPVDQNTTQTQTVSTRAADSLSGTTPDALAATPNPEPPKLAAPKLQGIFYNPSRPSAVVNGRTVYVGSRVGEARDFLVLEITRESVTVGNGSQTNMLVLGE